MADVQKLNGYNIKDATARGAYIRALNLSVSVASFVSYSPSGTEETAAYNRGYTYRAAVAVTGMTADFVPTVTFSLLSVEESEADILNEYQSYSGGVYIYSQVAPLSAITILSIEGRKAV